LPEKATNRPGRNDRCHCGSGKKYKQCCLSKDEAADQKARAKREKAEQAAAAKAAKAAEKAKAAGEDTGEEVEEKPVEHAQRRAPRPGAEQPWKRGAQNTRGFQKFSGPRKVGGGG
jgi:hypothetical protein